MEFLKISPALQNSLNLFSGKFASRTTGKSTSNAPEKRQKPFVMPAHWSSLQPLQAEASAAPRPLVRRRDESSEQSDLRVSSSQDGTRTENEANFEDQPKPKIKAPAVEYQPPFLLPNYNENYTASTQTIRTAVSFKPTVKKNDNQISRGNLKFEANLLAKKALKANEVESRILSRPSDSQNNIDAVVLAEPSTPSAFQPPSTVNIPTPATGLLPPLETIRVYDDATTQGPPIYFEWKIPASGLEPPKFDEPIKSKVTDSRKPESSTPVVTPPPLDRDLLPPLESNNINPINVQKPATGLQPPYFTAVPFETNHSFPSLASISSAIQNSSGESDKAQTPRSVSSTAIGDLAKTELNYLELKKEFLIPEYTFPLENVDRPGYEHQNAVNSFQIKYPDVETNESRWYGENAECPECHPSFLKPGTCEPCIKLR